MAALAHATRKEEEEEEEEEVFVVLDGSGTLELWPTPVAEARGAAREHVPVLRGACGLCPPATKVARAFRAGPDGMTALADGTRRPSDVCCRPRSS